MSAEWPHRHPGIVTGLPRIDSSGASHRHGPVLSTVVAVDVFVFLRRERLPTTEQWQSALDRLSIDVQLDASIDARSHSGYWPARAGEHQSGFEFFVGPVAEVFGQAAPSGADDRDIAANFVTHTDMRELQCSMLAAAALGVVADGLVLDDETESLVLPEQFLEQTRGIDFA